MAIEIQRGRSIWFYGRVTIDGQKKSFNLGVKIEGQVPPSLEQTGDAAFERSRARAQVAYEKLVRDLKQRGKTEELIQQIHEVRTGTRIESLSLADMVTCWKALRRKKANGEQYVEQAVSKIGEFIEFLGHHFPKAKEMADVQSKMAIAFMNHEDARGVSPKTSNNTLILLRSLFNKLQKQAGISENPFAGIPTRVEDTIHRKPFSPEELTLILEAAKLDPFIYPLIITGICTAMRRGDCCLLLRQSFDLENDFILVKTSKTGEQVEIPIFPALREVLVSAPKSSPYIFPELAEKYLSNPDNITSRVQSVLRRAGFSDPEDKIGGNSRGPLHQDRPKGLRRASVRNFYSLRVSWITISLTEGIPIELVRRVTGHKTVEIVLKHYFKPDRLAFRNALSHHLPAVLGGGSKSEVLDKTILRAKLHEMNFENWQVIRDQLITTLGANS